MANELTGVRKMDKDLERRLGVMGMRFLRVLLGVSMIFLGILLLIVYAPSWMPTAIGATFVICGFISMVVEPRKRG